MPAGFPLETVLEAAVEPIEIALDRPALAVDAHHAEEEPREAWREKSREAQPYGDRRFTSPSTLLYILSASALNFSTPSFCKSRSSACISGM